MATGILLYGLGLLGLVVLAGWALRALYRRDHWHRLGIWLGLGVLVLLAGLAAGLVGLEPRTALAAPIRVLLAGLAGACVGLLAVIDLVLLLRLAGASLLALPASWHLRRAARASDRDPAAAAAAYERSLTSLQRSGSLTRELDVLGELGTNQLEAGDGDRAEESFRRRVERARTTDDLELVASTLDDYCSALLDLERFNTARERYLEALAVAESSRDRLAIARVLYDLGWCEYLAGDANASRTYVARAVNFSKAGRDQVLDAHLLMLGGMLSLGRGEIYEARGAFEDSLRLAESIGDPDRLALARFVLGVELYVEGWRDDALEELEACLMQAQRPTWRGVAGRWLIGLSWVARSARRVEDAEEFAIWAQHLLNPKSPLIQLALYCEKPDEAPTDLAPSVRAIAALLDPHQDPAATAV